VERCGVVGSTLAFGSIGHEFESEQRLFSHQGASASKQAEITDEVLTGRFSSSTAVVRSAIGLGFRVCVMVEAGVEVEVKIMLVYASCNDVILLYYICVKCIIQVIWHLKSPY